MMSRSAAVLFYWTYNNQTAPRPPSYQMYITRSVVMNTWTLLGDISLPLP